MPFRISDGEDHIERSVRCTRSFGKTTPASEPYIIHSFIHSFWRLIT